MSSNGKRKQQEEGAPEAGAFDGTMSDTAEGALKGLISSSALHEKECKASGRGASSSQSAKRQKIDLCEQKKSQNTSSNDVERKKNYSRSPSVSSSGSGGVAEQGPYSNKRQRLDGQSKRGTLGMTAEEENTFLRNEMLKVRGKHDETEKKYLELKTRHDKTLQAIKQHQARIENLEKRAKSGDEWEEKFKHLESEKVSNTAFSLDEKEQMEKEIKNLKRERDEFQTTVNEKTALLNTATNERDKIQHQLQAAKIKIAKLEQFKRTEYERLKKKFSAVVNEKVLYKRQLQTRGKNIESAERAKREALDQNQSLSDQLDRFKRRMLQTESQLENKVKENDTLRKKEETRTKLFEKQRTELSRLRQANEEIKRQAQAAKAAAYQQKRNNLNGNSYQRSSSSSYGRHNQHQPQRQPQRQQQQRQPPPRQPPPRQQPPARQPPPRPQPAAQPQPAPEPAGTEEFYQVERILNSQVTEDGTREFLIKWKDYGEEDNSWEPEDFVSVDLVEDYDKRNPPR